MITGSTRRASPCPDRVATCATCGATTLPRPHQLVAAIYGYERASSATLVATIYAANSVAGLLLHAARCEGAKLPRCKVHEAVAMPHIWPKQDSAQIAAAVTSCHGICNTHRPVCATHICNSPRIRFHWPLSLLPLNCFFRSRIRDVFVTVLRCISVATFLLLAARSVMVSPGHLVSPLRWSRVRVYHVFRAPAPCPTLSTGKGSRIQFAISFLGRSPPPTPTVIRIWIRVRTRSRI